MKKRGWKLWSLAIFILLVAGAGSGFLLKKASGKSKNPGPSPWGQVARGDLEVHFLENGELEPSSAVDVVSQVGGRVMKIFAQEGDRVRRGQKLAVIQPGKTGLEKYLPRDILAPIGGVVMKVLQDNNRDSRMAREGDYITGLLDSSNPTALMTVADLSRLVVSLKISEMEVLKLEKKMPVKITVDALPNETFSGRIHLVAPRAETDRNGIKVFRVEVALDSTDPRMKPGMTARVDALLVHKTNALKIPLGSLFEQGGKSFVYIRKEKDRAEKFDVVVGLRSESEAELARGPAEGAELFMEQPKEKQLLKPAASKK